MKGSFLRNKDYSNIYQPCMPWASGSSAFYSMMLFISPLFFFLMSLFEDLFALSLGLMLIHQRSVLPRLICHCLFSHHQLVSFQDSGKSANIVIKLTVEKREFDKARNVYF